DLPFYWTGVGSNEWRSDCLPPSASFHRDTWITNRRTWNRTTFQQRPDGFQLGSPFCFYRESSVLRCAMADGYCVERDYWFVVHLETNRLGGPHLCSRWQCGCSSSRRN